ncbi:hypothetical protein L249_3063 [Ophiocordyceps polyrhachis-furcata BCC 54312]|uniref:Uncharacterized protein n=1 Tax=Ophiocordyceps polyrhachis-furcata BCC 54312 TaxID=1330021 RepID=A0A367LNU8_9HYPO|nr:hypothetical protein L249_3063 [Ophiocordyceps polyrhachis-furcata BCC 54312]
MYLGLARLYCVAGAAGLLVNRSVGAAETPDVDACRKALISRKRYKVWLVLGGVLLVELVGSPPLAGRMGLSDMRHLSIRARDGNPEGIGYLLGD